MIEPEKTSSFFNSNSTVLPRIASRFPWNDPLQDKKLFYSESHGHLKVRHSQQRDKRQADLRFTFYCKNKEPAANPQRKINSSQEHGQKRLKFVEKGPQQRLIKKLFQRRPHYNLRPLNSAQND